MKTMSVGVNEIVMRILAATAIALALLSSVAGCASRDQVGPSAMIGTPREMPVGVWRGAISAREMADSGGTVTNWAQLTIRPDGTFLLQDSSGARASGQVRLAGDTILLDGTYVSPASRAGEALTGDRLHFGGHDALYGSVETIFRGMRVIGAASLQRMPPE